MATRAEIVIAGRDTSGPAFTSAQRNLQAMRTSASAAAASVTASFAAIAAVTATVAGTLNSLNPRPIINYADSLNDLSERTGLAIETLSEYQFAAKLADVSNEQLAGGLKKLNENIAAAARGEKQQAEAFAAVGVAVVDTTGKVRAADAVFEDLADRFATYEDGANKVALATAIGGRSFSELITLLNMGSRGIREVRDEFAQLGGVISTDLARKSGEFNDNLDRLAVSADALKIVIAGGLIDSLVRYSTEAVNAAKQGDLLGFSFEQLRKLFSGQTTREFTFGAGDAADEESERIATLSADIDRLQKKLESGGGFRLFGQTSNAIEEELAAKQRELDTARRAFQERNKVESRGFAATAASFGGGPRQQAPALAGNTPAGGATSARVSELDAYIARLKDAQLATLDLSNEQRVNVAINTGALKGSEAKLEQLRQEARLLDELQKKRAEPEQFGPDIDPDLLRQRAQAQEELNRLLADAPSAQLARLQVLQETLNQAYREGTVTTTEYSEAVAGLQQQFNDLTPAMETAGEKVDEFSLQAARNIQDALGNSVEDVLSGSFDNILDNWTQLVRRMTAQAISANLAKALFGDYGNDGKIGGILAQFIAGAAGSSFQYDSSSANYGIEGRNYPARARGGRTWAGGTFRVNEEGPELLEVGSDTYLMMGSRDGNVVPAGDAMSAAGGTVQPVFNLNVHGAPSAPRVERRPNASGGMDVEIIFEEFRSRMIGDVQSGGPFVSALSGQTGTSRTPGLVR